ncbi:hypothetical protein YA0745_03990 [Pseudomonas synxantha]|uniref:Uncharacterized protein n=1 Tax=Pseudomonas synxantha TaxID=47883 RepID=A0ABS0UEJ2_9PSED|nr:hypothetical protein [Pseudomonas synxantha]MBI6564005.1 hypothetical protein [Pseudomonas synxantha]MBI6580386.1 hypothetical protein [Pseudomonas synxantha]MBI6642108.1 hypothetical protein [Pseudomonas synxantha]
MQPGFDDAVIVTKTLDDPDGFGRNGVEAAQRSKHQYGYRKAAANRFIKTAQHCEFTLSDIQASPQNSEKIVR